VPPSNRIGLNGPNKFVSFGRELFDKGGKMAMSLIPRVVPDILANRWYFPHAPAATLCESILERCGVPRERMFLDVFPRFGNVVSACVPLAIGLAQEQGVLQRGDGIVFTPVSAGMVASCVQAAF
jgi:3-oxoacyl-[acyl-carrier-protein] synthase III